MTVAGHADRGRCLDPGFYLLVPVAPAGTARAGTARAGTARAGTALGPAIPLTVRDDSSTAPILFKASTLTWDAYDREAGACIAAPPAPAPRHRQDGPGSSPWTGR